MSSLPHAPGPIRMYFCGPTVYQRIHIGNAVPFVLSMWLKRWLELTGYETSLVINITDINDKIYDAAPGAERRARRARDAVVPRGHRSARPRAPGRRADRRRDRARSDPDDRGADRRRLRLRVRRRRLLPRHGATPTTGASPARSSTRCASRSRTPARRIPGTSRSGRRTSPVRTRRGRRPGGTAAPAGTSSARRCPRSTSGRASRSTAAAWTSSSHTTRTRSRSHARSATTSRGSGCTTAC